MGRDSFESQVVITIFSLLFTGIVWYFMKNNDVGMFTIRFSIPLIWVILGGFLYTAVFKGRTKHRFLKSFGLAFVAALLGYLWATGSLESFFLSAVSVLSVIVELIMSLIILGVIILIIRGD